MRYYKLLFIPMWLMCTSLHAQLEKSALDYMLQKPAVSKRFADGKRFGDHLFLEAGAGAHVLFQRTNGYSANKPGASGRLHIGDWVTPEHGWRVGFYGGRRRHELKSPDFAGISLDYLLNVTALASTSYADVRPFEVYGVVGLEYMYARHNGVGRSGAGLRLGLRGQVRLSHYTYLYIEPQIGIYSDNVAHLDTWQGYVPEASVQAGLGYRLAQGENRSRNEFTRTHTFFDHTFLSFSGGPGALVNKSPSTWRHYMGGQARISAGKWFNPYSALRLSLTGATHKQHEAEKMKAMGLGAEYLWNMHNTFGGYDPSRWFEMNALAGLHADWSNNSKNKTRPVLGVGGGLQANFHLNSHADLFLEPRIDIYQKDYAAHTHSFKDWDAVLSLQAGLALHYNASPSANRPNRTSFKESDRRGFLTISAGADAPMPGLRNTDNHAFTGNLGFGQWFTSQSAWRIQVNGLVRKNNNYYTKGSVGLDYMADLTTWSGEYNPDRICNLRIFGGVGLGADYMQGTHKAGFAPDLHAGVQLAFRVSPAVELFAEPRVIHLFRTQENNTPSKTHLAAAVGLNYRLRHKQTDRPRSSEVPEKKQFVSVGIGSGISSETLTGMPSTLRKLTLDIDFCYGRWFNTKSGLRLGLSDVTIQKRHVANKHITSLHADYMLNIISLFTGESTENKVFQMTGFAGLNLNMSSRQQENKACLGGELGLQAGWKVCPSAELFVEPCIHLMDKRILPGSPHPFEGLLKLSIGSKVYF